MSRQQYIKSWKKGDCSVQLDPWRFLHQRGIFSGEYPTNLCSMFSMVTHYHQVVDNVDRLYDSPKGKERHVIPYHCIEQCMFAQPALLHDSSIF